MSIIGTVHEDITTDVLGVIGKWQWVVTIILTIFMLPTMLNVYEDMFLLKPSQEIKCILPEGLEITNISLCAFTITRNGTEKNYCDKWNIKLLGIFRIKKTWQIFCEDKFKLLSTTIICRLGFTFGCVLFGFISDSFGRKMVITINILAEIIFGCILTFCNSEAWFRLLIFLRSLFASGNLYMGTILICEIASNSWRSYLIIIVILPRVMAISYVVPLANSLPNLETLNFIASIYCFMCVALLRWLPESPQWLLYNRKISSAEKILFKAAMKNKIKLCSNFRIRPVNHKAYNCIDEERTCISIFYKYNTRIIVIFALVLWILYNFLWSFLYFKINTITSNMIYVEGLIFFGVFGCMSLLLIKKLKLKYLLLLNILVTGTSTSGMLVLNHLQMKDEKFGFIYSAALGTGMIAHVILITITPRLFTINVRGTIFGSCYSSGQLGTVVCYLLLHLDLSDHISVIFVLIGATFVLTGLCYMIPDVDERELPDVLQDMDYFSELSKPLRWATQKTNSPSQEEVEMRIYSFGSAVRNSSIASFSFERNDAQPIGLKKLWHAYIACLQQRLS